jgi:predicted patatin/cPLA2 family phospholipase
MEVKSRNSRFGKTVIVCQGGGAKGSWEAGFLNAFLTSPAFDGTICSAIGTSVGGLNVALLCQQIATSTQHLISDIWLRQVDNRLRKTRQLWSLIENSINSNAINNGNIYLYITATVSRLFLPFFIDKTSSEDGSEKNAGLHMFCFGPHSNFRSQDQDVALALRATSAFPCKYDPVVVDNTVYRDGGFVANNPVDIAMMSEFDTMIILAPHNPNVRPSWVPLLGRIEKNTQIRLCKARHSLITLLADKNKNLLLFYPTNPYVLPRLFDFSPAIISRGYNLGCEDANHALSDLSLFSSYSILNPSHFSCLSTIVG